MTHKTPPTLSDLKARRGRSARSELSRRINKAVRLASGYRTDTTTAIAREYRHQFRHNPAGVKLDVSLYQIRRLLSDSLRDAGCEDVDIHDMVLIGWGMSVVNALTRVATLDGVQSDP